MLVDIIIAKMLITVKSETELFQFLTTEKILSLLNCNCGLSGFSLVGGDWGGIPPYEPYVPPHKNGVPPY